MDLRSLAIKIGFDGSTAAVKEMDGATSKLKDTAMSAAKKLEGMGKSFTKVGKGLMKKVTAPVVGVGTAAIKTVADFDSAMSKVQAMSGATAEEFKQLRDLAREYGATTVFSASQAAEGMTFLAMAGLETNEIIDTMPGLLDLAAASGMDLGRAADIATNILSGFGMEAREAGRVADVLAAGASSANTSVEQLGDAMAVVAPVASTLGLEVEGLTAAVGLMSDAGIQGQQAGRMLRQGMLRLASPTGEAAKLIDDLGINVFDAGGNMKTLDKVVGELAKGLDGMSSQAQTAALSTIFGAESVAGWTALIDRGAGELAKFTTELEGAEGTASRHAQMMQDNIGGAFEAMKSQIEGLMISMGDVLKDDVRRMAEGIGNLASKFSELDEGTQKTIVKFGALAAATGPVVYGMGKVSGAISHLTKMFSFLSIAKIKDIAETAILHGMYAKEAIVKAASTLATKGMTAATVTWNTVAKIATGVTRGLGVAFKFMTSPTGLAIAGIAGLVAAGVALYKNWDTVKEKARKAWEGITGIVEGAVSKIKGYWTSLKDFMKNPIKGAVSIFRRDKGGTSQVDGSHARGLARVPFDGYIAELHKGEEVLTADDPRNINNYKNITKNIKTTQNNPSLVFSPTYNPSYSIEINGNATEGEAKDLIKKIDERTRRTFEELFYELSLQISGN